MQIDGSIEFKPAGMTSLNALPSQQEAQNMNQTASMTIDSQSKGVQPKGAKQPSA